ncbi:DUF805 domain-containing protein [Isoptericola sp. NPDC057391]|uniref:DUF805 domain-containing protein n=1 Tax=Isoptericola sp. NPDC057391 TaxID=3346117 RepID=UPI0036265DAF
MSFSDAIKSVFSQYANFSGRARRSEFWYFYLFVLIVNVVFWILFLVTGGASAATMSPDGTMTDASTGLAAGAMVVVGIWSLVGLALVLPTLAVMIRRLHDQDRSGFFWWLSVIPFVGGIIMLVLYAQPGTVGPNRFGADPKGAQVAPAQYGAPVA